MIPNFHEKENIVAQYQHYEAICWKYFADEVWACWRSTLRYRWPTKSGAAIDF